MLSIFCCSSEQCTFEFPMHRFLATESPFSDHPRPHPSKKNKEIIELVIIIIIIIKLN
jgi:hypothetical protein